MEFSKTALAKWLDELLELAYKNGKLVLCGIAAAAVLGLASLGYSYYDSAMQARAHKAVRRICRDLAQRPSAE